MRFTVTAERGKSVGIWVFQCTEVPGAISQGKHIKDAYRLMPEAIGWVADLDPSEIELDVDIILPVGLQERVLEVRAHVDQLTREQEETARLSREVVHLLLDAGLSGTDAAMALHISPQRISQLRKVTA